MKKENVSDRYAQAAEEREEALCCPVNYNPQYLKIIPSEVIDKDYGCGDPSEYVKEGETVLDLGSGGGKICFIAAQKVGPKGKVIGVDMTKEMLDLAKRNQPIVEEQMGYSNIEFKYGHIQDLKTDLSSLDDYLATNTVSSVEDLTKLEAFKEKIKQEKPLVMDNSIDVIVSNCVLNLVDDSLKKQLISEMFRVLKKGGRIAISDIVSDEDSPEHLKNDSELWSGCISGAFQEQEFVQILEEAGFYGIDIEKLDAKPWQKVEGIEYRSMTIIAYKGKEGPCYDKNHAVIYKGPFKEVLDDDGHKLLRGARMAVCEKTFEILTKEPYQKHIIPILPAVEVKEEIVFDCSRDTFRDPKETKDGLALETTKPKNSCC